MKVKSKSGRSYVRPPKSEAVNKNDSSKNGGGGGGGFHKYIWVQS